MSALVDEVFGLYRGVVMSPESWSDRSVADWVEAIGVSDEVDREAAKYLRRIVRMAEKLRSFWMADPRSSDVSIEWRSRVDIALGPKAWRPVLDLASHRLVEVPDEDLFATVGELFRVVNNRPWLEGVSYEAWLDEGKRN